MKKNIIIVLLFLIVIFPLVSCAGFNNQNSDDNTADSNNTNSNHTDDSNSTNDNTDDSQYIGTADVIVLAGQSNMEGHSWTSKLIQNTSGEIQKYYNEGFDSARIMYYCNKGRNRSEFFQKVKMGQGYGKGSFGPELGIAEELYLRERERPVYIIKFAEGGTNLYGQWNVNNRTSLYHQMVNYITQQLVYLEEVEALKPNIVGFFWMQGEADACDAKYKAAYLKNLENLVSSFRTKFEEYYGVPGKGIAFVDAGISDCSTWIFHEEINSIKKQFADSNPSKNYYFDTMEAGLEYDKDNDDFYHFDATSEIKLGRLFISTLLDNGWL